MPIDSAPVISNRGGPPVRDHPHIYSRCSKAGHNDNSVGVGAPPISIQDMYN